MAVRFILEAAGPSVKSYIGPAMGCVRILDPKLLRGHAEQYAPSLELPEDIPLEDVLFENLYMDLMHN